MYKYIFLVILYITFSGFSFSDPTTKIDPSLIVAFKAKSQAEYIVVLKNRKVYNKPLPFKTKIEKAKFVYESLINHARETQKEIISILKNSNVLYQSFYVTNAIKVTSDYDLMVLLASRDDVDLILDDAPIKMLDYTVEKNNTSLRSLEPEWGIKHIKADSVWAMGIKGQGVIIGGQDTGYDWEVSPLKKKYRGYIDSSNVNHNYNWHDAIVKNNPRFPDTLLNPCGYDLKHPCDDNNHGTHTMGTMVGEDDENAIGVAPGAKWIACRNMDRGWGQLSTYMDCFEWFLAPKDLNGEKPDFSLAPHVINNSWYCSEEEGCNLSNLMVMEAIVKNLKASGIVVVVSAGNSGNQGCGSVTGPPAFFEASFSVGAIDINGNIAGFSSKGPVVIDSSFRLKPNAAAPGVNVRSVIKGGGFAGFSGTSMAGPHMAGLVALMISANPNLAGNVEVIEDIIEGTCLPKTSELDCEGYPGANIPNAVFGYGIADALEAVKRSLAFNTSSNDFFVNNLNVYPNPVDAFLTFSVASGNEPIEHLNIFTLSGQLILNKKMDKNELLTTLDVGRLQSGIYIYEAKVAGQPIFGKFVKQ